ncbi:MAG: 4-(cytidine 5'-diphospho)-2-C-methyl-D-erythritol kinase [Rubrivivax sp.]|nr:4-(cytidine 5'-diphospho)-2-C-methyl-D-erythritol kinase [Rubrivivax sp.]
MPLSALYDLPAPAKLNLFLHVIGRRPDGYHLLESVFVPIDWCDRLHFERRDDGALARHDLGAPLPPNDLCLRAARALQAASGCRLGADISIDKQLPWGAGLGGGSSDAATTLLALNRLWGLRWPRPRLAEIGLALGADVPFFLGDGAAFVQGIGERLTPIALPQATYAVLKPAASIATRDIFGHPLLERGTEPVILEGSLESSALGPLIRDEGAGSAAAAFGRNDLQPPAEAVCPEVAEAARWLAARFGNSRMSGSGSAVFARVRDPVDGTSESPKAQAMQQRPAPLPPGWTMRICRSLPRLPLADWAGEAAAAG